MTTATKTKPEATGLYPKLAEAIAEVDEIRKDGRNEHFNYSFTSAEEVYRVIRGPLLTRGLLVIPSVKGSSLNGDRTTIELHLRIIDSATGEVLEVDWIGEGKDSQDKGPYKAYTGGIKTFLKHLFMLPADDDPENANGNRPAATAQGRPAQRSERPASAKQRGLIHALSAKAGISDDEQTALVQWTGGVAHLDRLPSKGASELIEAMGDEGSKVPDMVAVIRAKAEAGDERAAKIAEKYLSDGEA